MVLLNILEQFGVDSSIFIQIGVSILLFIILHLMLWKSSIRTYILREEATSDRLIYVKEQEKKCYILQSNYDAELKQASDAHNEQYKKERDNLYEQSEVHIVKIKQEEEDKYIENVTLLKKSYKEVLEDQQEKIDDASNALLERISV